MKFKKMIWTTIGRNTIKILKRKLHYKKNEKIK